ncbi:hypothetical protein BJV78DRAFT_1338046 [Lactifluus subvellereus]|nr:hypothetical protein BJV78DRAFT_1338046 [Lactifluus subvellereus]
MVHGGQDPRRTTSGLRKKVTYQIVLPNVISTISLELRDVKLRRHQIWRVAIFFHFALGGGEEKTSHWHRRHPQFLHWDELKGKQHYSALRCKAGERGERWEDPGTAAQRVTGSLASASGTWSVPGPYQLVVRVNNATTAPHAKLAHMKGDQKLGAQVAADGG